MGNTSTFHRARLCSSSRQRLSFWRPPMARAIAVGSFYVHNDQHSQIEGQVHSQRQTPVDRIQHTKNEHLPMFLHTIQEEGSSSTPGHSGLVLPCLLATPPCQLGNLIVLRNPCWYVSVLVLLSWWWWGVLSFSMFLVLSQTQGVHTLLGQQWRS